MQSRFLVLQNFGCKCGAVLACEKMKSVRSVGLRLFCVQREIFQEKRLEMWEIKTGEPVVTSVSAGPGAGLNDPRGSLTAQDIPWFPLSVLKGGSAGGKSSVPRDKSVL